MGDLDTRLLEEIIEGIKDLLKKDPAANVRNILESLGGAATPTQIGQWMIGDLFSEAE